MYWKFRLNFIAILIIASMTVFIHLSAQGDPQLETDLLGLVPGQEELIDWHKVSEPHFFNPDNLFEYIDGAADQYLLYGFRKVITLDYTVGKDSSSVNVEIYCMKSPMHAFGIYAAERSREETPITIGVQGYKGPNVLNFYKGTYYVKMMSFIISEDLMDSIEQMGKLIADKIRGEFKEPEIFRFFPVEHKVKQSERYIPTSFLGQSYLQNGYRCDYTSDQDSYQIFLIPMESDTAAKTVLKKYHLFLASQDYRILSNDDTDLIAEKEHFILTFVSRSCFGGVLNIKSLKQGQRAVETMKNNLQNR
jgi:hypothetical protein